MCRRPVWYTLPVYHVSFYDQRLTWSEYCHRGSSPAAVVLDWSEYPRGGLKGEKEGSEDVVGESPWAQVHPYRLLSVSAAVVQGDVLPSLSPRQCSSSSQ